MIWFFAFTSIGLLLTLVLLLLRRAISLGWRDWFGGAAVFALLAFGVRSYSS